MNRQLVRDVVFGRFRQAAMVTPGAPAAPRTGSPVGEAMGDASVAAPVAETAAWGPQRPPLAWRPIALQAAGLWLVTRLLFVLITYFGVLLLARNPATGALPIGPHALLEHWKRWDVEWYMNIASMGYWKQQATAFFPLYPLLIKGATLVLGQHWLLAAMIVSNLGTLGAFIGIALWAANEDGTPQAGVSTVRMLAAYPLSLFLFAAYSDGIFLALVAFTFYCIRRGSWWWAIACAALAGLSRPTAVVLVLPMLWEYGRQHGWWRRERWALGWRRIPHPSELALGALVVAAMPIGFALYEGYIILHFHQRGLIPRVESVFWHHTTTNPLVTVVEVVRQMVGTPPWTYWQAHQLLDVVPVVAFGVLTVVAARRLPVACTLYMVGLLVLAIYSPITFGYPDLLMSDGRYMLAAVPMFLLLGRWARRSPTLDTLLLAGGFMLQGVLTVVFINGGWLI